MPFCSLSEAKGMVINMNMTKIVTVNLPPAIGSPGLPRELSVPLQGETTLKQFFFQLSQEYESWFQYLVASGNDEEGYYLLILNNKAVYPNQYDEELVHPGDIIYLIPPVSGG
jgi:molybdopterin converting factor small subunit